MHRNIIKHLLIIIILIIPIVKIYASKIEVKKVEYKKQFQAPNSINRKINVYSDLNRKIIASILDFINKNTGLSLNLAIDHSKNSDIYFGSVNSYRSDKIINYQSEYWKAIDSFYKREGIFLWCKWYSCIAYNRVLIKLQDSNDYLSSFCGKITQINPEKDPSMLFVLNTLYKAYGKNIITDINDSIPVYKNSEGDLVDSIESGTYTVAITKDTIFKPSIKKGYPINLEYRSFKSRKYPVTTVLGYNIVFIPEESSNIQGAKFVIDFISTKEFQKFIAENYYHPIIKTNNQMDNEPKDWLEIEYNEEDINNLINLWKSIAYPDDIEKLLKQ